MSHTANRINIIILNYFGKSDTIECLDSLNECSLAEIFRIILVNNSTQDKFDKNIFEKYRFEVTYISNEKNLGFCGGNNLGLKISYEDDQCGYIMLLNNDTSLDQNAVNSLKKVCDQNPNSLLNPLIVFHNTKLLQCTGGYWNIFLGIASNINKGKLPDEIKHEIHPYFLNGCCIFGIKETFSKVGFLDETYFAYGEDIDFSIRAKRGGIKLMVVNDSIVYHKHSKSSNTYNKQYLICRNNYKCIKKNFNKIYFWIFAPLHFVLQMIIGYFVFKNKNIKKLIRVITIGYYDGIKNNRRIIK